MIFDISVGVMAYNEEANIGRLLQSILCQSFTHCSFNEILVVASGCTDKTEEIVRDFMEDDRRIQLLVQSRRQGKASAINLFLSKASGNILLLESADTIPDKDAFEKLVAPFQNPHIGMTGAHPIPVNSNDSFMGFTINLMWALHHRISLVTPKLGELVAFRDIVGEIPGDTPVDEAAIEAMITKAGYETAYVPDAVVRNKGPENVRDFMKQRRRIAAGHIHLLQKQRYRVSTLSPKSILKILIQGHSWGLRGTVWTLGAVLLETAGRALGAFDYYIRKKIPFIWEVSTSTKRWNLKCSELSPGFHFTTFTG